MKRNATQWATVNRLAELTGADARHVKKWVVNEAVPRKEEGRRTLFDITNGVNAIRQHQKHPGEDPEAPAGPGIDLGKLLADYRAIHKRHLLLCAVEKVLLGEGMAFPDTTTPEAIERALLNIFAHATIEPPPEPQTEK